MKKALVTGGSGFLGAGLVHGLVERGYQVRVFDDNSRGRLHRLDGVRDDIEFVRGDVRDQNAVDRATEGMDWVFHLAFVNGTRFFYERPDLVLEVGVKGALTTMDAAMRFGVERYIVASSSEVYQQPTHIPTLESERVIIPDVTNPRFSYSGGKVITELLTLHYLGASDTERIIFRPHNVYGPDMGWEHVVPEFIVRLRGLRESSPRGAVEFTIQGTGQETRAFCYVDDAVDGVIIAAEHGEDGLLYNVGVQEEISIAHLAHKLGALAGLRLDLKPESLLAGSTSRRCPDVSRLAALGYSPSVSLDVGLERAWLWYKEASIPRV